MTLGAGAQLPTFVELRRDTGASVVTLNRALESLESRGVLTRRHAVGIFVSPNVGRKSIAIICNQSFVSGPEVSPFWQMLMDGLRDQVAARGHELSVHFTLEGEGVEDSGVFHRDLARAVEAGRTDGVFGIGLNRQAAAWLQDRGVAVVGSHGKADVEVLVDFSHLARTATVLLSRRGCRRVALWVGHRHRVTGGDFSPSKEWNEHPQAAAYREGLAEAGLIYDPSLLIDSRFLPAFQKGVVRPTFWEQGYQMALHVFGQKTAPRIDGIVSLSELFTQGVLIGMERRGVAIGETSGAVQVAAHNNRGVPLLAPWADRITCFDVVPADMAETMARTLDAVLAGASPPESPLWHRPILRTVPEATLEREPSLSP